MAARPLVSIVVTAFNRAKLLGDALDSLSGQDYEPCEIVLVDDGSTDDTGEVGRGYRPAVRYHYQEHRGVGAALNAGLSIAEGELISFLDSDDLWEAKRLSKQVDHLQEHPETDIVAGQVRNFFDPELPEGERGRFLHMDKLIPGYVISAMLLRRKVFEIVGPFEEKWQVGILMEWFMRVREHEIRIDMLDDLVLQRRIHSKNINRLAESNIPTRLRILREGIRRRRAAKKPGNERE